MSKILIVEDEKDIIENLKELLVKEGFDIDTATRQKEALKKLEKTAYDLILLDISLPDGSGYAVCSAAKAHNEYNLNEETPIIFLTAYDDEGSVVAGLDMGGDDYITKPFRPRELISRINNLLRRHGNEPKKILQVKDIVVDIGKGSVHKGGEEVFLSPLEYKLLLFFMNNPGELISRTRLLNEIWDVSGAFINDNTLTAYIKRLRDKLEDDPKSSELFTTVRGVGYRLEDK